MADLGEWAEWVSIKMAQLLSEPQHAEDIAKTVLIEADSHRYKSDNMPMGTSGPVGVWRHRKGARYLVLGLASDSNNIEPRREPQVVYVSIESHGRGKDWPMHIRSLSEFYERFSPEALGPEQ